MLNAGIHPNMLFGSSGVLSCSVKEPRYVRGAYCRCCVRRKNRNAMTITTAMMSVGTNVEIRPDSEDDELRADPTFASL